MDGWRAGATGEADEAGGGDCRRCGDVVAFRHGLARADRVL